MVDSWAAIDADPARAEERLLLAEHMRLGLNPKVLVENVPEVVALFHYLRQGAVMLRTLELDAALEPPAQTDSGGTAVLEERDGLTQGGGRDESSSCT